MTIRLDPDAIVVVCDTCLEEARIDCVRHSYEYKYKDWGTQPNLAGWIDICTGNLKNPSAVLHFCSRDHAAEWRVGKGKRRKIARVVEYGAEVKEIEL